MRLPGTTHECGPIWELGWIARQLRLGAPIPEGTATIPVAQIVGTVERGHDFDRCWHPLHPQLARRLNEIDTASPVALDEPVDLVRVDRAYFVVDGHKRVALANRSGREFLDARVSRMPTPYAITPDLEESAIERTAREAEFRRHSGMAEAVPDARFVLTEVDGYGELFRAVQSHAHEMSEREGRVVPWPVVASDWYASVYQPRVEEARASIGRLIESCTDGDVFLAMNRLALTWWGSECDATGCAAEKLRDERLNDQGRKRSLVAGIFGRDEAVPQEPRVLPLADSQPDH